MSAVTPIRPIRAQRSQLDNCRAHTSIQQFTRRRRRRVNVSDGITHQRLRLRFVGRDDCDVPVKFRRHWPHRAGIQNHRNALRRCQRSHPKRQIHRNLQLQQHDGRFRQQACDGVKLGLAAGVVGAQRLHDAVLPAFSHADDRNAGTDAFADPHRAGFNSGGLQHLNQLRPKHIVANPAHHRRTHAHARRRHRLVRPLAAGVGDELPSHHCLPIGRQAVGKGDQVHVDAAQGNNQGTAG